jgi:hypothetical protein
LWLEINREETSRNNKKTEVLHQKGASEKINEHHKFLNNQDRIKRGKRNP